MSPLILVCLMGIGSEMNKTKSVNLNTVEAITWIKTDALPASSEAVEAERDPAHKYLEQLCHSHFRGHVNSASVEL